MNQVEQQNLINSIKQDDLILFSAFVKGNEDVSYGRFPLLTLCYLFESKKIIKAFGETLLNQKSYTVVAEPLGVYAAFKNVAGRCLRLYTTQSCIVSPIEMWAILHKDKLVKKHFNRFSNSAEIVTNLGSIYLIHKQKSEATETEIKIKKPKLNSQQKNIYKLMLCITISVMFVLSGLFAAVGVFSGMATTFSVSKIYTQSQLINALMIGGNYELKNDIVLGGITSTGVFNGSLEGNGYTIYVNEMRSNNLIETNNGTISNLNIEYVSVKKQIGNNFSLLTGSNNGNITSVNITCPELSLVCDKGNKDGTFIAMFSAVNNGTISNCNLVLNANLVGTNTNDCYASGFVGNNNGLVENCNYLSGSLLTEEIDVSGVVGVNNLNAEVKNCKNNAGISQTSSVLEWNPNVSGVATINYGNMSNVFNYGNLSVESTYEHSSSSAVFLGGICATNYGVVYKGLNNGKLTAKSNSLIVYCGGITAYTVPQKDQTTAPTISNCGSNGTIDVSVASDNVYAMVGGISGFMDGQAINCYSTASYVTGFNKDKYFIGLLLGACYAEYYFYYDSWVLYIGETNNNHLLYQENVESQIAAVITEYIEVLEITMPDNTITTNSSMLEITESGVWWNE